MSITLLHDNNNYCRKGSCLYPRSTAGGMWVYWIHPDVRRSVCPSVRPFVDKVSGTFWKKLLAQFISYLAFSPYGVSLLTPIHFCVRSLIFDPLVAKYLAENVVSGIFWKKTIGSINFIPGIYPYGVSFLTPIHFHVPSLIFVPLMVKYLAKNGVFGTFLKKKLLAQFNSFLAFTLMGWVSWPQYISMFLASFLALWAWRY